MACEEKVSVKLNPSLPVAGSVRVSNSSSAKGEFLVPKNQIAQFDNAVFILSNVAFRIDHYIRSDRCAKYRVLCDNYKTVVYVCER
jgi:hypothetical protein